MEKNGNFWKFLEKNGNFWKLQKKESKKLDKKMKNDKMKMFHLY